MFVLRWTAEAEQSYRDLKASALASLTGRTRKGKAKSGKAEGLFKQVHKTLQLLKANPRHPGLQTHEYHSLEHPYDPQGKVFEAYAQQRTPGAYRVFWCYGPERGDVTIIAITPHP
ncbi:MAG: hypothetical protein LLG00_12585 [Planctomycetaceae bacterium]|nr:hypothetical protein [Planctomycetaceae bacterium]